MSGGLGLERRGRWAGRKERLAARGGSAARRGRARRWVWGLSGVLVVLGGLGLGQGRPVAGQGAAGPWASPVASWGLGDVDPVAIAVRPDGTSFTLSRPLRTQPDFPALVRRDAAGQVVWERVVRDTSGRELRPIAVELGAGESLYVASADRVVALGADGAALWDAPAGDGHPDFGAAARGLSLSGDGQTLYGLDFVNARLLGYRSGNGQLRLRLGSQGVSPSFYSGPVDVVAGKGIGAAGDRVFVAERGNQRVQVLDGQGNPVAIWPLPARPRALTLTPDGERLLVLLEDDRLRSLGAGDGQPSPYPYPPVGGNGIQQAQDLGASDALVYLLDRGNRRILLFDHRLHADGGTETPTATATPPSTGEPVRLSACPGRPAELALEVPLPPAPPRADLMLIFDTTGSMESLISTAQARALEIEAALRTESPDLALGVMDVRDYPYGEAGLAADWPWQLRGRLSTEPADLVAATLELWPGGGGDAPEAYAGAIAASLDEAGVGWREGAQRFIVLLGDSVPRDADLNAGLANPRLPSPWRPGNPGWWQDSGPDWVPGTADDIDWQTLLTRLDAEGVTLSAGLSGAAPRELGGITGDLVAYWRDWTGRTGGSAVDLSNVGQLPAALAGMLGDGGRTIERLAPELLPAERAGWLSASPPEHRAIGVPDTGGSRRFDLSLMPPLDTPAGRYALRVQALGDGARYAQLEIELDWQPACGPTATATSPVPSPTDTPSPSATATASDTPRPSATRTPSPEATPSPAIRRAFLPVLYRAHCLASTRVPADIALLLDTSSSMSGGKLAAAVRAAGSFLEQVNLPRDHVAVLTFNSQARLEAGLTGSQGSLALALAAPRTGQGTRIDRGLEAALAELTGPRARSEALPVLILLTDGRPDGGSEASTRAAASAARGAGITLFTIGLGGDVDAALLRELAGGPARYLYAPDEAALEGIYRSLALELPCD